MNPQRRTVRQQAKQAFADSLEQLHETFGPEDEGEFFTNVPPLPQPSPEATDVRESRSQNAPSQASQPILRRRR